MAEPPCTICGATPPPLPSAASIQQTLDAASAALARAAELRAWLMSHGVPTGTL